MGWWSRTRALSKLRDAATRKETFDRLIAGREAETLLAALKDEDLLVRSGAEEALEKIADPSTVPTLLDLLADSSRVGGVVKILGAIRDPRAVGPLVRVLRDAGSWRAHHDVRAALIRIGDRTSLPLLVEALDDRELSVREAAVEILKSLGDDRAIPHFLRLMRSPDHMVRWTAIDALGVLRVRSAVEPLIAALGSAEAYDGKHILGSLAAIGDPRAVAAAAAKLDHEDPEFRAAAAQSLETLGWSPPNAAARVRLHAALGRWDAAASGGPDALAALAVLLLDRGIETKTRAAEALAKAGWTPATAGDRAAFAAARLEWEAVQAAGPAGIPALIAAARSGALHAVEPALKGLEKILEKHAPELSPDALEAVSALPKLTGGWTSRVYNGPCDETGHDVYTTKDIDPFRARQLAKQELGRRG